MQKPLRKHQVKECQDEEGFHLMLSEANVIILHCACYQKGKTSLSIIMLSNFSPVAFQPVMQQWFANVARYKCAIFFLGEIKKVVN